ncbi:radical SAM protein [Haloferula sargassicola]|uniref:GTP 3',8-cyclase n=1 Tax=Haloferula sargassicola TaxID=490096 RepID=A0ABP9UU75_9BACT
MSQISPTKLKSTSSRCPVCHQACPAEVWRRGSDPGEIWMTRICDDHGPHEVCLASDARFYWLSQGDPSNGCGAGCACSSSPEGRVGTLGGNATRPGTPEELSTCLALIEIVDSCNLQCPTCFTDAPPGVSRERLKAHPIADLMRRIEGVLERKHRIEILQLSGGEPTLHPELFQLIDWIQAEPRIDYCLLNTNGLRLARDGEFSAKLGERARRGGFQLYLQYDGPQEEGQVELRGGDLREVKHTTMERCEQEKIPFTLAMTVCQENLGHLWETITVGLRFGLCRGVALQPMFLSGRVGLAGSRLNTADLVLAAMRQSGGKLTEADFTPLPCGDPNCAVIGYLIRSPEGLRSISEFVDFASLQGFLRDKVRYEMADLTRCGCENTELGELLHRYEMEEKNAFRIFIKPFMDSWTWDQDRIDRCCTHVIRPDGRLDSFCRYYANGAT